VKVCCIPPNIGGSEKSQLWVGIDVWQMECQASNITTNVQSDYLLHGYMLQVFIATDQLHRPLCCAEIQLTLQQDASTTCPYRKLVLDTREK